MKRNKCVVFIVSAWGGEPRKRTNCKSARQLNKETQLPRFHPAIRCIFGQHKISRTEAGLWWYLVLTQWSTKFYQMRAFHATISLNKIGPSNISQTPRMPSQTVCSNKHAVYIRMATIVTELHNMIAGRRCLRLIINLGSFIEPFVFTTHVFLIHNPQQID